VARPQGKCAHLSDVILQRNILGALLFDASVDFSALFLNLLRLLGALLFKVPLAGGF
jgi:hypothetical protein